VKKHLEKQDEAVIESITNCFRQLPENRSAMALHLGCGRDELLCSCTPRKLAQVIMGELQKKPQVSAFLFNPPVIDSAGAADVADMLCKNKSLLSLHLDHNRIGDVGVQKIAAVLSTRGATLLELSCVDSNIGIAGAEAIASMLRKNRKLFALDLRGNNLKTRGWQFIAEALATNDVLFELRFDDGSSDDKEVEAKRKIISYLTRNREKYFSQYPLHATVIFKPEDKASIEALLAAGKRADDKDDCGRSALQVAKCKLLAEDFDVRGDALTWLEVAVEQEELAVKKFQDNRSLIIAWEKELRSLMHKILANQELLQERQQKVSDVSEAALRTLAAWNGFLCPITREQMKDPVVTLHGQSYEREGIENWLNLGNNVDPNTRKKLEVGELLPNHNLRLIVDSLNEYLEQRDKSQKLSERELWGKFARMLEEYGTAVMQLKRELEQRPRRFLAEEKENGAGSSSSSVPQTIDEVHKLWWKKIWERVEKLGSANDAIVTEQKLALESLNKATVSLTAFLSEIESWVKCPITGTVIVKEPVVIADGYTYEGSAIAQWLETHDTSPREKEKKLDHRKMVVNYAIKGVLELLAQLKQEVQQALTGLHSAEKNFIEEISAHNDAIMWGKSQIDGFAGLRDGRMDVRGIQELPLIPVDELEAGSEIICDCSRVTISTEKTGVPAQEEVSDKTCASSWDKPSKKVELWFSRVYLGRWKKEGEAMKEVAIKRLYPWLFTLEVLQSFDKDAARWAAISPPHPNIVQLYGRIGFSDDDPAGTGHSRSLVMELMYISLYEVLHNNNGDKLDWGVKFRIARDIAEGLRYLHTQGIQHCNLNSHNVFLERNFTAKIGNIGFWQARLEVFSSPLGACTRWTAPEVVSGSVPKKTSDIYSFGMILLELATQRLPYEAAREERDAVQCILDGKRERVPEECKREYPEYAQLTEMCLSDVRAKRPDIGRVVKVLKSCEPNLESAPVGVVHGEASSADTSKLSS